MSQPARVEADGFVTFFRSYTKTWVHAVATAGLTAFGTLTIVHNWFVALALASYVLPPIVLYLYHGGRSEGSTPEVDASGADGRAAEGRQSDHSTHADASGGPARQLDGRRGEQPVSSDETSAAGDAVGTDAATEPDGADETTEPDEPAERTETDEADQRAEWRVVESPTTATLRDVTVGPSAAYAVGDGGTVITTDDDGGWTVVLEDGPAAGRNDLHGVDATADGAAVWVAGDSGALGRIDAETGRHTDYTAPADVTDNWLGVAVGGASGEETVLLITGSGAVHAGRYEDGTLEWADPTTPGTGSSLSGVALTDGAVGYCCDTNDGVFETTDGGESYERVGIDGADGTLTDLASGRHRGLLVSDDDGVVHRYDENASTWTPERVTDSALSGIDRHEDDVLVAAADGAVHERRGPTADWERTEPDVSVPLLASSLAADRAVVVGENGTVAERG